ncbi:hypothetical protein FJN14_09205 [Alteromonas mediterranea]|uniref:hypothetical protein n=1 Tax=Alteromonas mediterranea TaxID=314275 RepID=UPI00113249DD|nr:hypothetical protein [Alteromonas mediterranea]QDG38614.1 hypothetical protein FJN14_09205 [Alteromonas mediterranea]
MKVFLVIFLALSITACAGSPFKFENARKVQAGMSQDELTNLLGKPYMVTTRGQDQIWVWSHANGMTGAAKSVSFVIRDGKVVSVPTIPDSFE